MKKQDLIRKLEQASEAKGFITASQFARFMGRTNVTKCRDKYLADLPRVDKKYYFIPDVADMLMMHSDSAG